VEVDCGDLHETLFERIQFSYMMVPLECVWGWNRSCGSHRLWVKAHNDCTRRQRY